MVKRGGLPEVGPLGSFLPVSHVIKTKPPDCLPGQVREVKPDEEHNERERCWPWDWQSRAWEAGESGRPEHIYLVVRHGSTMLVFTCCVVLTHGQTQTELGNSLREGGWMVFSHSPCSSRLRCGPQPCMWERLVGWLI